MLLLLPMWFQLAAALVKDAVYNAQFLFVVLPSMEV